MAIHQTTRHRRVKCVSGSSDNPRQAACAVIQIESCRKLHQIGSGPQQRGIIFFGMQHYLKIQEIFENNQQTIDDDFQQFVRQELEKDDICNK